MNSRTLTVFWYAFTAITGILIGSVLGQDFSVEIARGILILGVLFLIFLWRPIERASHIINLEEWQNHQVRGRWHFIFTRYFLLRGSVLVVLLIAPGFIISGIPFAEIRYTAMIVVLVAFLTIAPGYQEWTDCEREHQVRLIQEKGDHARATSALNN